MPPSEPGPLPVRLAVGGTPSGGPGARPFPGARLPRPGRTVDHYHIWVNLRPGVKDLDFCANVDAYLGTLAREGLIAGYELTRRKLGFGPASLGEFHVVIKTRDMGHLEEALREVARRRGPIEELHHKVHSSVADFTSALYRTFPGTERT